MKTEVKTGAYAWYALGLLAAVNLFNYVDRTLLYILFAPIKKEMSFTDFELALLGTTSFVIFFTVLGVPFGRLADRGSRKNRLSFLAGGLVSNTVGALRFIFSGFRDCSLRFSSIC